MGFRYASTWFRYATPCVRYARRGIRYAITGSRYASRRARYASGQKRYADGRVGYAGRGRSGVSRLAGRDLIERRGGGGAIGRIHSTGKVCVTMRNV